MSLDAALALLVALACAAWLARRGVRALRGTSKGCGCGKAEAAPCPQAGGFAAAARAAARRAAAGSRAAPR